MSDELPSEGSKLCSEASVGAWLANNPVLTCPSESSEAGDEIKSTCSSHHFSSPHPSDPEDHIEGECRGAWKRRGGSRPAYPKSERQQMALLKQITHHTIPNQMSPSTTNHNTSMNTGAIGSPHHTPLGVKHAQPQPTTSTSKSIVAKVNKRNVSGETALHISARKGEHKKCRKLILQGTDVNAVDNAGWTALHEACNYGYVKCVSILLKFGANVNVAGFEADTPLHDAVSNGHEKIVSLLLSHGANVDLVNEDGKKPLDLIEEDNEQNDNAIRELLLGQRKPTLPNSPSPHESDVDSEDTDDPTSPKQKDDTASVKSKAETRRNQFKQANRESQAESASFDSIDKDVDRMHKPDKKIMSMHIPAPIPAPRPMSMSPATPVTSIEQLTPSSINTTPNQPNNITTDNQHALPTTPLSQQDYRGGASSSSTHLRSLRRRDLLKKRRQHHFPESNLIKKRRLHHTSPNNKPYKRVGRPPGSVNKPKTTPSPATAATPVKQSQISDDVYEFHSSDSDDQTRTTESRVQNTTPPMMLNIPKEVTTPLKIITDEKCVSIKKRLLLRSTQDSSTELEPGTKSAPPSVLAATEGMFERLDVVDNGRRAASEHGGVGMQSARVKQRTVPKLTLKLGKRDKYHCTSHLDSDIGGRSGVQTCGTAYLVGSRRGGRGRGRLGRGRGRGAKENSAMSRLTRSQLKYKGGSLISPKKTPTGEAADLVDSLHPHKRKHMKAIRGGLLNPVSSCILMDTGESSAGEAIEPKVHGSTTRTPADAQTSLGISITTKNSTQAYSAIRQYIESKWTQMLNIEEPCEYKPPKDYKNFMCSKKDYLLKRNAPQFECCVPSSLPSEMRTVFEKQEQARHSLNMQHRIERETLIMSCEREILRCSARKLGNNRLSVTRIMNEADIYNPLHVDRDQWHNNNINNITNEQVIHRFTGRKRQLINRQRMEAQSLWSAQQLQWEGEMRRAALLLPNHNYKHDNTHLPQVKVVSQFALIPSQ